MMGFKLFNSARGTLSGIEAMNMIRKGQVKGIEQGTVSLKPSLSKQYLELLLKGRQAIPIVCP